jgi:hypothetical protein
MRVFMSGGSLDYVCYRLDDAIDTIERRATTTLHKAFASHLKDVAKHYTTWNGFLAVIIVKAKKLNLCIK